MISRQFAKMEAGLCFGCKYKRNFLTSGTCKCFDFAWYCFDQLNFDSHKNISIVQFSKSTLNGKFKTAFSKYGKLVKYQDKISGNKYWDKTTEFKPENMCQKVEKPSPACLSKFIESGRPAKQN